MKDKNSIIKKIVEYIDVKDTDGARKLIENDLKRFGTKYEYFFYKALICENLCEKCDLYTKALTENPKFIDAYINRGLIHNELKEYEKSIDDYDKAIDLDSKCALAYNNRGYTKYKQKDYEGALKDYNKSILLNPKLKIALDNKAKLLSEVCMKDDKDFSEKYYLSVGISEVNSGAFVEAIQSLDESLKFNPEYYLTYFYKGVAYHSLGKTDEAYENYTKSININKKMADAYFNRGQLIYKQNPKMALDDFVSAVAIDPNFIDAYYSIAAIQKNMGQYKDAIKNLDKLLELEPQAVNARALRKLILSKYIK